RLYDDGYSVKSNGELARQLHEAVARLPEAVAAVTPVREEDAPSSRQSPGEGGFTPPPPLRHIGEGSLFVRADGAICRGEGGQGRPATYGGTALPARGTRTGRRRAPLVGLRDRARRVLQSQNEGWPEEFRAEARRELNWAYDRFAGAFGPINKTT